MASNSQQQVNMMMSDKLIESVLFIRSNQPSIGRGWPPDDAKVAVADLGFQVMEFTVASRSELESVVANHQDILVWPVSYTIGAKVDGPLITAVLEDLGVPFVGPTSANLELSSKLKFKTALESDTPYLSPMNM